MSSKIDLQYDYYFLSKEYEFSDYVENALMDDYVENSHLYDKSTFGYFQVMKMIGIDINTISVVEILEMVRSWYKSRP